MKVITGVIIKKRGKMSEIKFDDGTLIYLPFDGLPGEAITIVIGRNAL